MTEAKARELALQQHLDKCDWVTMLSLEDEQGNDQSDAAAHNLFSAGWTAALQYVARERAVAWGEQQIIHYFASWDSRETPCGIQLDSVVSASRDITVFNCDRCREFLAVRLR